MEKLIRKSSYSMMGRIDMFLLLRSPLPRFLSSLILKWMQSTQFLRRVRCICVTCVERDVIVLCFMGYVVESS